MGNETSRTTEIGGGQRQEELAPRQRDGKVVDQARGGDAWRVDASLPVLSFMRRDVIYLRENMWVDAAVSSLSDRGLRDAPVLDDDGRPVGVLYVDDVDSEESFSDGDRSGDEREDRFTSALLRGYGLDSGFHLEGRRRMRVREVMVPYIPEISAEASIASAALVMHDNQLDHVMVVGDDGRAVGTFSREELVDWLVQETSGRRSQVHSARCLRDVMQPAITVRRRASLFTARDLLTTHDRQALPVVEGGGVVGLVLEADVYGFLAAHRDDDGWVQELLVEDVMKAAPPAFDPDTSVDRVRSLLSGPDILEAGCVLVEQDGRLIGLVTHADLHGHPVEEAARLDSDGEQRDPRASEGGRKVDLLHPAALGRASIRPLSR